MRFPACGQVDSSHDVLEGLRVVTVPSNDGCCAGVDVGVVAVEVYAEGWKVVDCDQHLRRPRVSVQEFQADRFKHQALAVRPDNLGNEHGFIALDRGFGVAHQLAKWRIVIKPVENGNQALAVLAVLELPPFGLGASPDLIDAHFAAQERHRKKLSSDSFIPLLDVDPRRGLGHTFVVQALDQKLAAQRGTGGDSSGIRGLHDRHHRGKSISDGRDCGFSERVARNSAH